MDDMEDMEVDMKEIFLLLSRYNAHANRYLFDSLESFSEEELKKDAGSWFGSIFGILNHILVSDLLWLNRYRTSGRDLPSLNTPVLDFSFTSIQQHLYDSFEALRERRMQLDEVITRFAGDLDDGTLTSVLEYTNSQGIHNRLRIRDTLVHWFNHQTHHRGQISQILDSRGITHDYSGVTGLLEQVM